MSQNSFPRSEHVAALQAAVQNIGKQSGAELQVLNSGLDRFRCQYRLTLTCPSANWSEEIVVHFQVAEKLLAGGNSERLSRQVNHAIQRHQQDADKS
jgi:hypothetical protein